MKKHAIRIVGGEYRRTPIAVPDVAGLRPTPDRVRETLFNWLTHLWGGNFADKRVLDLFAGTGALGFEAASRGVEHIQMVESNQAAVSALRALRNRLGAKTVRIHAGDALHVLERLRATPFDLVLLDPPFGQPWLERLWEPLHPLLITDSLVYVESGEPLSFPAWLSPLRSSRAGHVHFGLARFAATQNSVDNLTVGPQQPSEHPESAVATAPVILTKPEGK